jgi:excisionase family DNA binding protein
MRAPVDSAFQTLDQITALFPIPLETIRHWIKVGKLQAFKPGRRVLVRRADIEAMIEAAALPAIRAERARARKAGAK